jgi:hypothetical protein
METITLQSGDIVDIYQQHEMWRADSNDVHFCAETKQALIESLKYLGPSVTPQIIELPPVLSPLETFVGVINSDLPLVSKQEAWRKLKNLANDNAEAKEIVYRMLEKPFSYMAEEITHSLGKPDFLEVSHEELVKHINNLVVRNYLVLELSKRLSVNAATN